MLKTFRRWVVEEDVIDTNPIDRIKTPDLKQEPLDPVPLPHVKAMLATCKSRSFLDVRDKAIQLALLNSGCRASEFLALNVDDVNLPTGALIVRQTKGGRFRTTLLGAKSLRELVRTRGIGKNCRTALSIAATALTLPARAGP